MVSKEESESDDDMGFGLFDGDEGNLHIKSQTCLGKTV